MTVPELRIWLPRNYATSNAVIAMQVATMLTSMNMDAAGEVETVSALLNRPITAAK